MACVVGVEELPLLPLPPHDVSVSASMKTKKIEITSDLERCNTAPYMLVLEDIEGGMPLEIGNIGMCVIGSSERIDSNQPPLSV